MKKRIGIQGFLIFLSVCALIFFARYLFAFNRPKLLDGLFSIFGVILILLGYALRISSRGIKAQKNPDGKTLVTSGPYALTRNPMYLGTLLIGLGVTTTLFKWWVFLVFLAVYLAIYIPQINREEKTLSARFQDKFKEYCRLSPKFFPRLTKLFGAAPEKYFQIKANWAKKELPSLIYTLVFIVGLKIWIYFQY